MLEFLGIAFILLVSALLLRSFGWRGAPVFAAVCGALLISEAVSGLALIFDGSIFSVYGDGLSEPISAALKILGLGYLFGICADICRELGEPGIAKSVEVAGRVEIMLVVLPFFEEILRVGSELME